jgi:hypothetical protein
MAEKRKVAPFNVAIVGQGGRLEYEAALFALSFRAHNPDFPGRLLIAEPQPGPCWDRDPRIKNAPLREILAEAGAEVIPFENRHFGQSYPYGNKIEMLSALPGGKPFVFFDTDTLITGELTEVPFDFDRPSASLRREGTWPEIEPYGPGYHAIWKSLYDKFGLEFESSIDPHQPEEYWARFLYFNAGFFYFRDPQAFGARFLDYALAIRDDPPPELVCQPLDPWLDQVALPLVIHSFGGGRDALAPGWLDGTHSCHYRMIPMLYARESDAVVRVLEEITAPNKIKKVLKDHEPCKRMIYQGRGEKARALFDRDHLPSREQMIRNSLKKEGYWMR